VFERFGKQAHRILDLAQQEAERCGHRYLGPEHVLLGVLADGHSRAAQLLWAHGVELEAARAALGRLVSRGMVPAPQPSDADLLGTLGIDLDAVRHTTEQAFGAQAVGEATWRVTRRHGWGPEGWCGHPCADRRSWPGAPCSSPPSGRAR
jgi:ATP-dependent Clp protease ATP-binding subunit ClpA